MKYEFEIDGVTYTASQIGGRKALELNRQIERICLTGLKSIQELKEKMIEFYDGLPEDGTYNLVDLPIAEGVNVISIAFDALDDKVWNKLVMDLVAEVKCTLEGKGTLELGNPEDFDKAMSGRIGYIYHILFHVMKNNGFTPFVLATFGELIRQIGI